MAAEANAKVEDAEPPEPDEHQMVTLAETAISPTAVLWAVFLDAPTLGQAGFAIWRVENPDSPDPVFTSDVIGVRLDCAAQLCNLIALACLGRAQAPTGGTVH